MSSVKVAVRVRPINKREINHKSRCIIQMVQDKTGTILFFKINFIGFATSKLQKQ